MSVKIPLPVQNVIHHCGITQNQLIGQGGEGFIFNHSSDTILKVYPNATKSYLESLITIQKRARDAALPYQTPEILNIEHKEGLNYTIERKLPGQQLDIVFPKLSDKDKYYVLEQYIKAMEPLKSIKVADLPYGQLVNIPDRIQASSWSQYLLAKLDSQIQKSHSFLERDVDDLTIKVQLLQAKINQILEGQIEKNFVHADYYLNNLMVNENLEISAVLDLSAHAVVGDHRLDIASINFLTLNPSITPEHLAYVREYVIRILGSKILPYLDLYGLFYAFYYSDLHDQDPHSYQWCLNLLNDKSLWGQLEKL